MLPLVVSREQVACPVNLWRFRQNPTLKPCEAFSACDGKSSQSSLNIQGFHNQSALGIQEEGYTENTTEEDHQV